MSGVNPSWPVLGRPQHSGDSDSASAGQAGGRRPPPQAGKRRSLPAAGGANTALRDNLEWIAVAILLVLGARQIVVEAFKIPTGSMAPTLLGVHKEVRCPNCGWVFYVGYDKLQDGTVQCPNCLDDPWSGASDMCAGTKAIQFRRPAWLWHEGICPTTGGMVVGADAANRVNRWGSRIFVNKFIYRFRMPRRWEVIVFLHPSTSLGAVSLSNGLSNGSSSEDSAIKPRQSYIKRLVGLPGEEIAIRNGDVYVNGEIARKPPDVQKRIWQHVYDSGFVPRRVAGDTWSFGRLKGMWQQNAQDGSLTLNAFSSDRSIEAAFGRPILDLCEYNGGGGSRAALRGESKDPEVGDCRIEALLTVESCRPAPQASVVLRIVEDGHDFVFSVPVGDEGTAVLSDGGRRVAGHPVEGVRPGETVRVVLENYDDLVVAKLRGAPVIVYPYSGGPVSDVPRKRVAFGAAAAKVLFHRIKLQRDIYYEGSGVYKLDEKSCFVLGDNSPQSSDSRRWDSPGVPTDDLVGLAFAAFWPVQDMKTLSSRPW